MVLLLVVLFISWLSFLFLLWGWMWWRLSSSHDFSFFSLCWSSFFCLYLASFLQVQKLDYFCCWSPFSRSCEFAREKKDSFEFIFLDLQKMKFIIIIFKKSIFGFVNLQGQKMHSLNYYYYFLVFFCLHTLF